MMNEENNKNRLNIHPEQLWNSMGMIQQAVMATVLLAVYTTIYFIVQRSYVEHPALVNWLDALHKLFSSNAILKDVALGVAAGFVMVLITAVFDILIAVIQKQNISEWIHRIDHLLPETTVQKRWALSISLVGSTIEEIMFRGFIFIALMNVWGHWIWASLIISAVFSLLHAGVQDFWSTVWIFIISMVLCAIIAMGGSIYMVVIIHIMINLSNLFILPLLFSKKK